MSFSDALRLRNATFCSSTLEGSCVFVTVEEARGGAKILFSASILRPEWQKNLEFEVENVQK